ncbi:MAG: hypothetical protein J6S91_02370 [Treponema sp.]|nr:hypothetical protein [Treponema sp.]
MFKRKGLIFFCLLAVFLCSCEEDYSNYDVKINFTPAEGYTSEIEFLDDMNPVYERELIESLKKARKVTNLFVPKSRPGEGRYQILLYEDGVCVGDYEPTAKDYMKDNNTGQYLKCENVLNDTRSLFYLQIMKNHWVYPYGNDEE